MSEKKLKPLIVVVDPGFSALKIIVNKHMYSIPSDVIDMTKNMDEYKEFSSFDSTMVLSECIEGRKFVVGEQTRKIRKSEKYQAEFDLKKSAMESEARFDTDDFEAQMLTALAYGIINYSQEKDVNMNVSDLSDYDIFVGIPLPHAYYESAFDKVKRIIEGSHEFDITIGDTKHHINFTIGKNRTVCHSQTMCLLLSESLDDEGNMIPTRKHYYDDLPALILDGGYGTFGIVEISEGYRIGLDKQESNTTFAMRNVNEIVAERINAKTKGHPEIKEYNLEDIYKSNKSIIRYLDKSGSEEIVNTVDANIIRSEVIDEISEDLIKHICSTHGDLLHIEQIIIGGGTGYAYAEKIKEFAEHKRGLRKVHLTDNTLDGKPIEPVYAVAAGMYKYAAGAVKRLGNDAV